MHFDRRLDLRIPEEEKKAWELYAQKRGITVSELIRRSVKRTLIDGKLKLL